MANINEKIDKYLNEKKYDVTYSQMLKVLHGKLEDAYRSVEFTMKKTSDADEKRKCKNIMKSIEKAMEEVLM